MTFEHSLLSNIKKEKSERLRLEATNDPSTPPNFNKISSALDHYYFLNKLQVHCAYLSYSQIVNSEILKYDRKSFKLIEDIILLTKEDDLSKPYLKIYNQIRILLESKELSKDQFDHLFDQTRAHINQIVSTENKDICQDALSLLSNISIRKMNEGEETYYKKMFDINCSILNLKYSGKSKLKIPAGIYKNMVVAAFKIKSKDYFRKLSEGSEVTQNSATEWAEEFTESFKSRLLKKERTKYYTFCKAYIKFQNKNFEKAYKILDNPLRLRGMFINMNIRQLHLMVIFELQLTNPDLLDKDDVDLKKYCESLRKLIADDENRKKQLSYQANYFKEFEKLYRNMIRIYIKYRLPYMSKDKNYLKERQQLSALIHSCQYSFKEWFESKYNQTKQAH